MSWQQLADIAELNRRLRADEVSRPPLACPHDGTPLQPAPAGADASLFCPMGDYQYPTDPNPLRPGGL